MDKLFNPELIPPPRPTISNLQWISGTQYVSPSDLDLLIGGPDRPPSKLLAQEAGGSASAASGRAQQTEGWAEYMTRQLNERTEKLGIMGESMERVSESSAGWANDVGKFVQQQKRKAMLGVLGSKFGI